MKKTLLTIALLALTITSYAQQLAFPGAEGFGAYATGGRGGTVVHVTNLKASGTGSLADAVSQPNRIVVFDVGGVIDITGSAVTIASNVTIAGQTAPGEGITVYGGRVIASGASNIIIRYLRMRGSINLDQSKCTLTLDNTSNVILDHCSISWGRWDDVHIKDANNVTWQYCIIAEGIDPQRFGSITDGTRNWTVTHCLWIDNKSRNPKMKCYLQYVNNVVYNFGSGIVGGHSAADNYQDVISNYFIAGPSNGGSIKYFDQWTATDHLYSTGNYADGNCDGVLNGTLITDYSSATPMANPNLTCSAPLTMETAEEAYKNVVLYAGASLVRDSHDKRLITQLTSLGKLGAFIDNEQDVGGIGSLSGGTMATDTDGDGMSDEWEKANGLDPAKNDAGGDANSNGYSNIEDYLNSMTQKSNYLMYPLNVKAKLSNATTVVLTWTNSETDATGIIVEISGDGKSFMQADSLQGDATTLTISGLVADKIYYFRLKTVKDKQQSLYSATVSINDGGLKAAGGTTAGTSDFVPQKNKLYRIINYGTVAYNSSTTNAGTPKYLTFLANGALGSTTDFAWDDPSLLWSITPLASDSTSFYICNHSTKKYLSPTNVDLSGSQLIVASTTATPLKIVYVGNGYAAQSGTNDSISQYRINCPSNNNCQIRAKNFPDNWIWGSGTITRADMVFTFSAIDSSLVHLYLSKLSATLASAAKMAQAATVGDVTLGYPQTAYDRFIAIINESQTFLDKADSGNISQQQVDSVAAVVSKAQSAFASTQILNLAGYDTDKLNNIYSFGTTSNASTTTASTTIQRRYLVATKTADGLRDSLIYKVGLSETQITDGQSDPLSLAPEAQWFIAPDKNGNVFIRNEKYGSYLQISNLLSATAATVYPYYAKEDNGHHAFYMETSNTNTRCFNVGAPNSDGKSGPLAFASPADRTRLRWVIEELDIDTAISTLMRNGNNGRLVQTKYYNLLGNEVRPSSRQGIYIQKDTFSDGHSQTKKIIAR
jgi:hypothetical protein